jgi:hypothetical protein
MRFMPSEVHAHEVHAHEVHTHEVHAHETYAYRTKRKALIRRRFTVVARVFFTASSTLAFESSYLVGALRSRGGGRIVALK